MRDHSETSISSSSLTYRSGGLDSLPQTECTLTPLILHPAGMELLRTHSPHSEWRECRNAGTQEAECTEASYSSILLTNDLVQLKVQGQVSMLHSPRSFIARTQIEVNRMTCLQLPNLLCPSVQSSVSSCIFTPYSKSHSKPHCSPQHHAASLHHTLKSHSKPHWGKIFLSHPLW